jgi:hypothetical protein
LVLWQHDLNTEKLKGKGLGPPLLYVYAFTLPNIYPSSKRPPARAAEIFWRVLFSFFIFDVNQLTIRTKLSTESDGRIQPKRDNAIATQQQQQQQ